MKHDNFDELWAKGYRQYDTDRELRMIPLDNPHRELYETGEIVITSNYYRDTDRGHFGNGVAILTPDEAPQLRLLDGTPVPTAWLNEATDDAQMLLLDYDHLVAVRLHRKHPYHRDDYAYYPTPGALPVPNVPILVSQPDRKAALRANKRLKILQGVANFRMKASSEPLVVKEFGWVSARREAAISLCLGEEPIEKYLETADKAAMYAIQGITPKDLSRACRIVTEHTYLKF